MKSALWLRWKSTIGPSLRYATAKVNKASRSGGGGGGFGSGGSSRPAASEPSEDPWGSARHRDRSRAATTSPSENPLIPESFSRPSHRAAHQNERDRQMAKSSSTKRRPAPEKPIKTRKCVFCSKKGKGR